MTRPGSRGLIGLLAADLPGHRLVRGVDGAATFIPEEGGVPIEVRERVEKRFLGRTVIARFSMTVPAPGQKPSRLKVIQTGHLKRSGIEVRMKEGAEDASELAGALAADPDFATAASALDFTRFDIDLDGESCVATVELLGASLVSIALPPIRSYVRLHPDQREALLAGFGALSRLVA